MMAPSSANNGVNSEQTAQLEKLAAQAEKSLQQFQQLNAILVDTIKKFLSGEQPTFTKVSAAVTIWANAKLKHRDAFLELERVVQGNDTVLDDVPGLGKRHFTIKFSVFKAQDDFDKAYSLLKTYPQIDEHERNTVFKVIDDTENQYKDSGIRLGQGMFSVFGNNIFMV